MRYSVCIDMMFQQYSFSDRIAAVTSLGIDTVEFWKWSNKDIPELKKCLSNENAKVSIFNLDSHNSDLSARLMRGILNTDSACELSESIKESAEVYHSLGAAGLIVLIGENLTDRSYEDQLLAVLKNLEAAAETAEKENVNLLVEPLNATDRKNYFMPYSEPVFKILRKIGSKRVKMLFDIYHQQMTEGGIIDKIRGNIDLIGHFHIADCPGRHEPGTGELDYKNILSEIDKLDFKGFAGLEYRATVRDEDAIGRWMKNV